MGWVMLMGKRILTLKVKQMVMLKLILMERPTVMQKLKQKVKRTQKQMARLKVKQMVKPMGWVMLMGKLR